MNESSNRSTLSALVSVGSVSFKTKKLTSHNLDSSSSKTEREYMAKLEATGAQVDASVVQSKILGSGSEALNDSTSEPLEFQGVQLEFNQQICTDLCLWPLRKRWQEMHLTWFPSLLSFFAGIFF